ncbi:MAG: DUF262 domain-containing protein [Elusimicrobiota bacterium]|jgi:hypothetical protein|nr:DUF262 domain-containing protein [Elusimicrobiota bacterium]
MKIELHNIPICELVKDYKNSDEEGVIGYGGRLDIRPKYQREFVYKDAQRDAVIDTVRKGFPLNVMYWVKNPNNAFEVLDGQQRIISICEYIKDGFGINFQLFSNLTEDQKEQILKYELMVYFCEGTDSEKLSWFKVVNIAGAVLTAQELRNAVYTGAWLSDAKKYFSKTECPAGKIGGDYLNGSSIRQEYLETAIEWISDGKIEEYMSKHQNDPDALELWSYFQNVITWTEGKFPKQYKKEMKGVAWGTLYNEFKNKNLDPAVLEKEISRLMRDKDVSNKKGIFHYVLNGREKHLNIRAFDDDMKREAFEKQKGICKKCKGHFEFEDMRADHIKPWSKGGKTEIGNCQLLCQRCNAEKSDKY